MIRIAYLYGHFSHINGIKFSLREVDVLSCIANGRSYKKTGILLGISTRTVETHVYNIFSKIRCNSRDGILDFIEQSPYYFSLRNFYLLLKLQSIFELNLKKLFLKQTHNSVFFNIFSEINDFGDKLFTAQIIKHLSLSGCQINEHTYNSFFAKKKFFSQNHIYFINSCSSIQKIEVNTINSFHFFHNKNIIAFSQQTENQLNEKYFHTLQKSEDYFLLIFEIMITAYPLVEFSMILDEFKKQSMLVKNYIENIIY